MDNQLEENLPGAPEPNLGGDAEGNLEGIVPANVQGNLGVGIQTGLELNRQRSIETDNIFREIFLKGENLSELSMVQQGFIRAQELARKFHNTMMARASYAGTPHQGGGVQGGGAHPRSAEHGLSPDRIGQGIGMRYSKDSIKFTGAKDQAFHEVL
ncbi:hypothetical protein I4F81_008094 [Pyropia yezoensis]|uniref:Uncharacterized protein n=1 Tax=Pyropia yezoensis TaxID=2788 RepID=A0ACC3C6F3_PYRYE|nr:hypothetical protein I4F81_008094 [Neopyropia yezoensis]